MPSPKLSLQLDFRSGLPIYTQIVNQISSLVANGVLKPDDQLPTVRAMAQELRINFNTVARAYRLLSESGIISTQQGRGTYILEIPPPEVSASLKTRALETLTDRYLTDATRLGFSLDEIRLFLEKRFSQTKLPEENL
ncbi:MAG: GntR family transcriptional regulator [Anaerolineales bacterium]|nr:GntR family transcriptional regulator [Anaerolineales bacterium]MCX7609629.1 GntR family transcriptional regulator [Anaerolineales bacterium]MDW8227226.1 GntR family transcriptional regulator [Anaerolineales bacterium]